MRHRLALAAFTLCALLGLLSGGIFVQGLLRDRHVGDPELPLELARVSQWSDVGFRVWRAGDRTLFLTTVNHQPAHQGSRFAGAIEVRVTAPDGRVAFQRLYTGDEIEHVKPGNMHWTPLARFGLDGGPWRRWTLAARVVVPDPRWDGAISDVRLRTSQADLGMGGMINYVMVFPAALFLGLAALLSPVTGHPRVTVTLSFVLLLALAWLLTG